MLMIPDPASPAHGSATVIGLMSGTSHDAIDAAAAQFRRVGDALVMRPMGLISVPYAPELRARIVSALPPASTTMEEVCRLDTGIGRAFAEVAVRAEQELCGGTSDLIVSHGQTMFHWVDGSSVHGTLQIGDPAWIAEATGTPVVADLRSRDVAAGGQGAPLVSLLDVLWMAGRPARPQGTQDSDPALADAALVNLGGIANATLVRPGLEPIAFDIGPANALVDAAVRSGTQGAQSFDADGALASRGSIDTDLLDRLLSEPYYAAPLPRTTGKELFHGAYLDDHLAEHHRATGRTPRLEDLVATLTALTARIVADSVRGSAEVIIAGGGTRNPVMLRMLAAELPGIPVRTSDEVGLPSAAKEALAFAMMGLLSVNGLPGTVPSCTGARHASILGSITPTDKPLPRILGTSPTSLRIES